MKTISGAYQAIMESIERQYGLGVRDAVFAESGGLQLDRVFSPLDQILEGECLCYMPQ